jgi:hypothetical protein
MIYHQPFYDNLEVLSLGDFVMPCQAKLMGYARAEARPFWLFSHRSTFLD